MSRGEPMTTQGTVPKPTGIETREQRVTRIRLWTGNREKCRRCGYLRINVCHEPDPVNAPEGLAYYKAIWDQLHEFVPSGEYEPPR